VLLPSVVVVLLSRRGAVVAFIVAADAWFLNAARTYATQRWRRMACGTNECSYATVGGGLYNTASGL